MISAGYPMEWIHDVTFFLTINDYESMTADHCTPCRSSRRKPSLCGEVLGVEIPGIVIRPVQEAGQVGGHIAHCLCEYRLRIEQSIENARQVFLGFFACAIVTVTGA
jgi:hypothetical protein